MCTHPSDCTQPRGWVRTFLKLDVMCWTSYSYLIVLTARQIFQTICWWIRVLLLACQGSYCLLSTLCMHGDAHMSLSQRFWAQGCVMTGSGNRNGGPVLECQSEEFQSIMCNGGSNYDSMTDCPIFWWWEVEMSSITIRRIRLNTSKSESCLKAMMLVRSWKSFSLGAMMGRSLTVASEPFPLQGDWWRQSIGDNKYIVTGDNASLPGAVPPLCPPQIGK